MFRTKTKPSHYAKRYARLANSTKKINVVGKTSKRGGIKL